jgi:hypothetical protein
MTLGTFLGWSIVMPAYWRRGLLAVGLAIIDVHVSRLPYAITGLLYASCVVAFGVLAAGSGYGRPLVRAVLAAAQAFAGFSYWPSPDRASSGLATLFWLAGSRSRWAGSADVWLSLASLRA